MKSVEHVDNAKNYDWFNDQSNIDMQKSEYMWSKAISLRM